MKITMNTVTEDTLRFAYRLGTDELLAAAARDERDLKEIRPRGIRSLLAGCATTSLFFGLLGRIMPHRRQRSQVQLGNEAKKTWFRVALAGSIIIAVMAADSVAQAQTTYTYSTSVTSTSWLNTSNWTGNSGHWPGVIGATSSSNGATTDIATFGSLNISASTIGINMTTANSSLALGAIDYASTLNKALIIGTSTANTGTLTLNGATLNGIANTILSNESTQGVTIQNNGGNSSGVLSLGLGNATNNVIQTNNTGGITISSAISGNGRNLTFQTNSTGLLTLSGANTFSGTFTANSGTVNLGVLATQNGALGGVSSVSIANGATVQAATTGFTDTINNSAAVTVNGTLDLTGGTETIGSLAGVSTGVLKIGKYSTINATGAVTVGDSTSTIFAGVISGTPNAAGDTVFTKQGSGTLALSGTNTYTGNTSIAAGTLQLGNGSTTGALSASSAIAISSGATLAFNRNNATTQGTDFSTAAITGAGSLAQSGSGVLTLNAANTFSGGFVLNSGTLAVATSSVVSGGATTSGAVGMGTLTLNGGTLRSDSTTARTINNNLSLSGSIILGDATNTGALTFNNTGLTTQSAALTANTTLITNSAVTISDVISGAYSLTKAGAGTLTLTPGNSSGNSYTGGTTINNGTVSATGYNALGNGGSLAVNAANGSTTVLNLNSGAIVSGLSGTIAGTGTATINIVSGTTLTTNQSTSTEYDGVIAGTGGFTMQGTGASLLYLTNGSNSYTGGTIINGGTLAVNGPGRIGNVSGTLTINNGTFFLTTIGGTGTDISVDRNIVLGNANSTFSVDAGQTYTATSNALVSGSGTLNKAGTGTLILANGNNSYGGGTTVTAGTLLVNNTTGSGTGAGAVNVNGGLFGGSGTSQGVVTVASGATISPGATGGDSISTLTVGAGGGTLGMTTGLAVNGTMRTNLSVPSTAPATPTAGTNYDQTSVVGALTLGTTSILDLRVADNYGMTVGEVFYIVLNDGVDPISGTFSNAQGSTYTDNVGDTYTISYQANGDSGTLGTLGGNDISLTVTSIVPVPEPATVLGGLLTAGLLGYSQRRKIGGWLAAARSHRTALAA